MTHADELADQLQAGIEEVNAELAAIPNESWFSVDTAAERWTVGHTAHQVTEALDRAWRGSQEVIDTRQPVVIDEAAIAVRTTINARRFDEHASEPRAATVVLLRDRGGCWSTECAR